MTAFHVVLPSNGSSDSYPDNTPSKYTTKLSERIQLDGDYEVGLSELIYPHTWFNFNNEAGKFWFGIKIGGEDVRKFFFKSAYYQDGTALATDLNRQVSRSLLDMSGMRVRFTFNASSNKFIIETTNRGWLIISNELMKYLGFTRGWPPNPALKMNAGSMFTMNRGMNLMYIYSDVASYSVVGDLEAPLLHVCSTSGRDSEMVKSIFTHPFYVPVARNDFESIEIDIRDELGRRVPFLHGRSIVTLHFRRKYNDSLLRNITIR
jgi:hypothetical protein